MSVIAKFRWKLFCVLGILTFAATPAAAQKNVPNVVQPGAPGQPTRKLPSSTRAVLLGRSPKDVEFMQHMIVHHNQAVEMTALINARTQNKELRRLGSRISQSQTDEMNLMRRWLETRGEPIMSKMAGMPGMEMADHGHHMLMPGMLTQRQMEELKNSTGKEFDRLFLEGMIQHHNGALLMVGELFDTAGAGQDADLFNFATDVDSGQRAEIRIMQAMLAEKL